MYDFSKGSSLLGKGEVEKVGGLQAEGVIGVETWQCYRPLYMQDKYEQFTVSRK